MHKYVLTVNILYISTYLKVHKYPESTTKYTVDILYNFSPFTYYYTVCRFLECILYSGSFIYLSIFENSQLTVKHPCRLQFIFERHVHTYVKEAYVEYIGHGVSTCIQNIVDYIEIKRCLPSI